MLPNSYEASPDTRGTACAVELDNARIRLIHDVASNRIVIVHNGTILCTSICDALRDDRYVRYRMHECRRMP